MALDNRRIKVDYSETQSFLCEKHDYSGLILADCPTLCANCITGWRSTSSTFDALNRIKETCKTKQKN